MLGVAHTLLQVSKCRIPVVGTPKAKKQGAVACSIGGIGTPEFIGSESSALVEALGLTSSLKRRVIVSKGNSVQGELWLREHTPCELARYDRRQVGVGRHVGQGRCVFEVVGRQRDRVRQGLVEKVLVELRGDQQEASVRVEVGELQTASP